MRRMVQSEPVSQSLAANRSVRQETIPGTWRSMKAMASVGPVPRIEPGRSFHYNSYHVVRCESRADGGLLWRHRQRAGRVRAGDETLLMEPPMLA